MFWIDLQEFLELEVDIQNFFSSDAETLKNAILDRYFENRYPPLGVPQARRPKNEYFWSKTGF